jgi:hypothetical protein
MICAHCSLVFLALMPEYCFDVAFTVRQRLQSDASNLPYDRVADEA